MTSINELPYEVLMCIFNYAFENLNQAELMDSLGNVCPKWRQICMESPFWRDFDGSVNYEFFKQLCREGSLKNTETLKFAERTIYPSSRTLKLVYKSMPNLKSINFSNVHLLMESRKENVFLSQLQDNCPNLSSLTINDSWVENYAGISTKCIDIFLTERGHKLTTINVSFLLLQGHDNIFKIIAANCPNLEQLIVEGLHRESSNRCFPIELVQNSCLRLKVIRLGYPLSYMRCRGLPAQKGFPQLETFSHPDDDNVTFDDTLMKILLSKSTQLKELDLRGCDLISLQALSDLPITKLESFSFSKTRFTSTEGFCELLKRFSNSLKEIDASKTVGELINDIVEALIPANGVSNLIKINLSNTHITEATVRHLICNCPRLKVLNLENCRSLRRGTKLRYEDRTSILQLLLKLNS